MKALRSILNCWPCNKLKKKNDGQVLTSSTGKNTRTSPSTKTKIELDGCHLITQLALVSLPLCFWTHLAHPLKKTKTKKGTHHQPLPSDREAHDLILAPTILPARVPAKSKHPANAIPHHACPLDTPIQD
jgi:hypothetical protein